MKFQASFTSKFFEDQRYRRTDRNIGFILTSQQTTETTTFSGLPLKNLENVFEEFQNSLRDLGDFQMIQGRWTHFRDLKNPISDALSFLENLPEIGDLGKTLRLYFNFHCTGNVPQNEYFSMAIGTM